MLSSAAQHAAGGNKIIRWPRDGASNRRRNVRSRRSLALLEVLLIPAVLLAVAVLVGTIGPSAPSSAGPATWAFAFPSGLATYDPAEGYDLWLMADGSTWTYTHGDWANITSTSGVPVGMEDNSRLVYDAEDGYVLLYGGAGGTELSHPLNDTWTFQGGQWTNRTGEVRGSPPTAVLGLMAYDSEDRAVVLFGGSAVNSITGSVYARATNATWSYAGGVWTNVTVPAPPPFAGFYSNNPFAGLVDDPTDGYVLYYNALGIPASSNPVHPPEPIMWSYVAGVWTNRTASLSTAPQLIPFAGFLFDSTSRSVIAAGTCVSTPGYTCEHRFGATFQYAGGVWSEMSPPTGLPARDYTGYVDDPSDGGVMVVGGCCWADFSGLSLGWQDLWIFAHGTWTEVEPWGGTPSWTQNGGTWLALALGLAAVGVLVVARPPSRRAS